MRSVRLLTNNPAKIEGLASLGIAVRERIPLQMPSNPESRAYLEAKVARMRHIIKLNGQGQPAENLGLDPAESYGPQLKGLCARIQDHPDNSAPFVTLSYAQSLDGCLTTSRGTSFPISAPASLTMTHTLRAAHSAILVGIGTVLADDPALTVRLVAGDSPQPVVVDTHLHTPPDARLLHGRQPVWIATTPQGAQTPRRQSLEEAGARIFTLPTDEDGRVDLAALLSCLGAEGMRSLMVEGGGRILTSFLEKRLANYAVITIAPIFLGGYPLIQSARKQEELRSVMPRLQNVEQVQLMSDTVLWGEVA